ncbi:MAG: hypothetical protein Q8P32_00670 [Candidatus Komeilibacteria bacterium]|nr:hypothetical protein [Candidatus Komeilibacteria bacterium]
MIKFIKLYLLSLTLAASLFLPGLALAQDAAANLQSCDPNESLQDCQKWILEQAGGGPSGYGSNTVVSAETLAQKVGQVIGMVLSVFGVVFFGLVVYSGIQWMTAGGNEEKVTHARERIIRAAIGLGIVMMSYALTSFIVDRMRITPSVNEVDPGSYTCPLDEGYSCEDACGEGIEPTDETCPNNKKCCPMNA